MDRVLNFASRKSTGRLQVKICWQTVRESSCSERTVQSVVNWGPDEDLGSSPNRRAHPCEARDSRPRGCPTSISHQIGSTSIELQAAESIASKAEPASLMPDLPRAGGLTAGAPHQISRVAPVEQVVHTLTAPVYPRTIFCECIFLDTWPQICRAPRRLDEQNGEKSGFWPLCNSRPPAKPTHVPMKLASPDAAR